MSSTVVAASSSAAAASRCRLLRQLWRSRIAVPRCGQGRLASASIASSNNIAFGSSPFSTLSCNRSSIRQQDFSSSYPTIRTFATSYPPHEVVGLPSLSPTMSSGSIAAWNVAAGDKFNAGDVFCSVETDKAVVDFEAQDEGVIAKILVAAGTEVAVGTPVMIVVEDAASVAAFDNYVVESTTATAATSAGAATAAPVAAPTAPAPVAPPATPAAAPSSSTGRTFASPLARKLAKEMGYNIASIAGTGPVGRVIASDVKSHQPAAAAVVAAVANAAAPTTAATSATSAVLPPLSPVIGAGYTDYPISQSAAQVAARLVQSKRNVPHYYLTVDVTADALLQLRRTVNATVKDESQHVGVYEFLIKAAAVATKTVPAANASWMESAVRLYDRVDINIVTGSGESLATPVIRDVVGKGLRSISNDLTKGMALASDDAAADTGVGTLTMINVGMYGVKACAPIIREPQACAVAIGALQHRIVPSTSTKAKGVDNGSQLYQESVGFTVTASFDHRVVDGAVGAQWLAAFKSHVENPSTLLL